MTDTRNALALESRPGLPLGSEVSTRCHRESLEPAWSGVSHQG